MNIVYLHTHDLGRYVQPWGNAFKTPAIQQLAEEGISFRHAFAVSPSCSPSRAGLLTGCYPHQVGINGLASAYFGYRLNDFRMHLGHTLREAGYRTALAGIHHVGNIPWCEPTRDLPYDEFLANDGPFMNCVHDKVVSGAVEFIERDHDRPFFLSCGFGTTHHSQWQRIENESQEELGDIDDRFVRPLGRHPDSAHSRAETAQFMRSAEVLDHEMKQVLDAIDRSGKRDDTLVICTTDHGPGLPGIKGHLNDDGTGVFLILRGPQGFSGGKVVDAMVSHLDLFPTLCDLLNLEAPKWLEGKSLLPLVRGEEKSLHERLFFELGYHGFPKWQRAVRTERYRYIRYYGPDTGTHVIDTDGGLIYDRWVQQGRSEVPYPRIQLYDIQMDPMELKNLAGQPQVAAIEAELKAELEAWQERTDDPLRHGSLPPPPADEDPNFLATLIARLEEDGYTIDQELAKVDPREACQKTLRKCV